MLHLFKYAPKEIGEIMVSDIKTVPKGQKTLQLKLIKAPNKLSGKYILMQSSKIGDFWVILDKSPSFAI